MPDEISLRARDLGEPEEPDRPPWRRQRPSADGGLERPRDFQDRRAPGGVVVGAGRFVAEVRRENDLAGGRVRPRNRRDDDVEGGRDHLRGDASSQSDLFASRQARSKFLRLPLREHEGEAVDGLVGRQVPPAHEVAVVAGPCCRLVREVGEKARGSALLAGQAMHERQGPVGQDDLPLDRLPLVILRVRAAADVHQLRRHVGVLAVVGERDREIRERLHETRRRRDLLESRRHRVPGVVAPEVRVAGLAVGGEALDGGVREARREELPLDMLRRRRKPRRAVHAVEPPELAHRLERRVAVHRRMDRRRRLVRPERDRPLLREKRGGCREQGCENECEPERGGSHPRRSEGSVPVPVIRSARILRACGLGTAATTASR